MLHAMIMAGGGGTRFWPRSRIKRPKQFLQLTGDRTLLQMAVDRIEAQVTPDRTWIITSALHREEAARQLPQLPADRVVGEPCGRDTAACIGLGAALIARQDPNAVMLVYPDSGHGSLSQFHESFTRQAGAFLASDSPFAPY